MAIAPGQVEGIDIEASQIAAARARAVERDLTNVQFQVGNIYELPFAADSFDGVFAHTVLQHLSDPLRALGEMRRVLRPHGIIGLRDDDLGTLLLEPSTPLLRLWESLHIKVWTHNDGNPFCRQDPPTSAQRGWLHATAGFFFLGVIRLARGNRRICRRHGGTPPNARVR